MIEFKVEASHLVCSGIRYFRGGAEYVEIGSEGKLKRPVFGQNFLSVWKDIKADVKADRPLVIEFDDKATSSSDFSLGADFKPVDASAGNVYSRMVSHELKLVLFSVDRATMVKAINDHPSARAYLRGEGNDARVALAVFKVVRASTMTSISNATSFALDIGAGSLKGSVGSSSTSTITLGTGTTLAYLPYQPKWDGDRVNDLVVDEWSFG